MADVAHDAGFAFGRNGRGDGELAIPLLTRRKSVLVQNRDGTDSRLRRQVAFRQQPGARRRRFAVLIFRRSNQGTGVGDVADIGDLQQSRRGTDQNRIGHHGGQFGQGRVAESPFGPPRLLAHQPVRHHLALVLSADGTNTLAREQRRRTGRGRRMRRLL